MFGDCLDTNNTAGAGRRTPCRIPPLSPGGLDAESAGRDAGPRPFLKENAMAEPSDVFEIMHNTRAMRRLKPDPVPDALIARILKAGVCAPNGGNTQRWRFLVIKDTNIKKAVQTWYKRAFDEV